MNHIRIFRQYIPLELLFLILLEYCLLVVAVYAGYYLRFEWIGGQPEYSFSGLASLAYGYGAVMLVCMLSMGAYRVRGAEGLTGLLLKVLVAIFLLGTVVLSVAFYLFPYVELFLGRGVLALSSAVAVVLIAIVRFVFYKFLDLSVFHRRILIVGAGERAFRLWQLLAMTKRTELDVVGFYPVITRAEGIPGHLVDTCEKGMLAFCIERGIHEVVVAVDERRREGSGGFPLEELLDCKLGGIDVLDEQSFYERETGKIDVQSLSAGWMVFSNGFTFSPFRDVFERGFDFLASLLLLLVTWPVMILTALLIKVEDGLSAPVFYSQERVGYKGRIIKVHKFRSMRQNAESDGVAVWARENDDRVTMVGKFIRQARIDELPQIFNVFKGEMSFVGPRPERPQFVSELAEELPFYNERHRVKPGITGWAQLCYPYGATVEDAKQKLQYDLYYIKNHSLFF